MELMVTQSYQAFKQELDSEIKREAEGFVKIGYLLRLAKETDILKQSEYANVNDFAKKEYGLDASQVSRFISINERFSEGGYSERLEQKYEGFGVAKLSIMLQLPDALNEELTPEYTKSEINMLREEVKEEAKTSDLEIMMEPQTDEPITQAILEMLDLDPTLARNLYNLHKDGGHETYKDIIAPSGTAIKTVRVEGLGRVMLKFDETPHIKMISVRNNTTDTFSEDKLAAVLDKTFENLPENLKHLELHPYQREVEEAKNRPAPTDLSKIAPVQKESKVTKAEKPKPVEKVKEEEAEIIPPESQKQRDNFSMEKPSEEPEKEEKKDTWEMIKEALDPTEEEQAKIDMIVEFFEHDIAGIKQMIKINPTIDYLESAIARGLKFVDMLRELMYIKKRGE